MTVDLLPIVTTTTTQKNYNDTTENSVMVVTETEYRLQETDRVWIGSCSVTVERGNRYNDGQESTLRLFNYSEDLIGQAVLDFIKRNVAELEDTSDFTRNRAERFMAELNDVLPAHRVTLPGETVA